MWAVFGPAVGWSFIGTGLYAWRRRPESRTGVLMVLLGFAWFLVRAEARELAARLHDRARRRRAVGRRVPAARHELPDGPAGARARPRARDRRLPDLHRGLVPAMLFAGPHELGCDDCPTNVLLIAPRPGPRDGRASASVRALRRSCSSSCSSASTLRWRRTPPLERLQLTPVYVCGAAHVPARHGRHGRRGRRRAGGPRSSPPRCCRSRSSAACCAATSRGSTPSCARRLEELRASRARLVEAGDAERRRLERDLHDGAQSRLVALALLLGHARRRVDADAEETASLLDRAHGRAAGRAWPSCASSRAASTRRCSPSAASSRRCTRSPRARRCR